ncbi:hypothetical protein BDQ17DRAFT_1426113 [Cyathus striatus]|nr:hypothetical protein BDQ17DRAFT_1426113 [Cyathus striatus]
MNKVTSCQTPKVSITLNDTVGSLSDPIQTRHWSRAAEQITAAGPPVDAGHLYRPIPPRLQGKTRLAGEQITGAGPPTDPSHPYHSVPPRLHGRTQLVEQAGILLAFEWNENHRCPMNQHRDRQRLRKARSLIHRHGPGLGASGPPPHQSLSPAPSLITLSTPTRALLPPSLLLGTSAAFFSGNPAQPSEAGPRTRCIRSTPSTFDVPCAYVNSIGPASISAAWNFNSPPIVSGKHCSSTPSITPAYSTSGGASISAAWNISSPPILSGEHCSSTPSITTAYSTSGDISTAATWSGGAW